MPKRAYGRRLNAGSERKLSFIRDYLNAYVKVFQGTSRTTVYLDLFAGPGNCTSKTGAPVEGSPLIALSASPPFSRFIFCDLDPANVDALRQIVQQRGIQNADIREGDANTLARELLASIPPNAATFALLDPQALDLYYDTVLTLARGLRTVDFLINFPISPILRVIGTQCKPGCGRQCSKCPDHLFPSAQWRDIALPKRQGRRRELLEFYMSGLEHEGFRWAAKHVRNAGNTVMYDLVFATRNVLPAMRIMRDVMYKDVNETLPGLGCVAGLQADILQNYSGRGRVTLRALLNNMFSGCEETRYRDFQQVLLDLEKEGRLTRTQKVSGRRKQFQPDELFIINGQ